MDLSALHPRLRSALMSVPAGAWCVGVSGGADSVALLRLLSLRGDLRLHVAHLDHQTRGEENAADARFVKSLCDQLAYECTIAQRDQIEPGIADPPRNRSARYRAARLAFFADVVRRRNLDGLLLGHHADDQAETIYLRLLRGAGPRGLRGMSARTTLHGMAVLRPLLEIRRDTLRAFLGELSQSWREDSSNASARYARNRVRADLLRHPQITDALLDVAACCARLSEWTEAASPTLSPVFATASLADLPAPLASESARRWIRQHIGSGHEIPPSTIHRLCEMARDVATPSRQQFPNDLQVRRRGGSIFADLGM